VAELAGRLGVVQALDAAVGPIKQRDRGLTAGGLLLALAQTQMLGGDFLVSLDRRRADAVGEALSAVPTPASTTTAGLAARFSPQQVIAVEDGLATLIGRVMQLLPVRRRVVLQAGPATIDLDGTEVECYGRAKDGICFNYLGQRAGRPHVASWAEAGMVLAADLLAGDEDPRAGAADLIADAAATLATVGVSTRPRVRTDAGYFAAHIAWAAVRNGCDFSVGVVRNPAVWKAVASVPESAWRPATGMKDAQVAVTGYAPAGWPPGTRTIVRRVKIAAGRISADPRSRRRRTIPKGQLTLALEGLCDHAFAYSFIATNVPVYTPTQAVALEIWHRGRTSIEDRIRDAKHGAALRHLPSADRTVNTIWMWAALLAVNLSAWLQELSGLDSGDGHGRAHLGTLRHRLLAVPARVIRHAGKITLRLPPGQQLLSRVLARLRQLPAYT